MALNRGRFYLLVTVAALVPLVIPTIAGAGTAYVYLTPDGSTLITDSQVNKSGYTLKKKYTDQYVRSYKTKQRSLRAIESTYDSLIFKTADRYGMDRAIIKAIVHAESAFNPQAISAKGATGLMQLMPGTAKRYGVRKLTDPEQNLQGGVRYFRDLLKLFRNDLSRALAAYNAGEGAVRKYHGIPPYSETRGYVRKVIQLHNLYRRQLGA